jgi:hypothetical protein
VITTINNFADVFISLMRLHNNVPHLISILWADAPGRRGGAKSSDHIRLRRRRLAANFFLVIFKIFFKEVGGKEWSFSSFFLSVLNSFAQNKFAEVSELRHQIRKRDETIKELKEKIEKLEKASSRTKSVLFRCHSFTGMNY